MLIKWRKLGLPHREYTARVVYLLLLAIPFAALALLSLFAFLNAWQFAGSCPGRCSALPREAALRLA